MRFDTSQQMKLGQQMKLAPRMIQSMEILQLPIAALEERIEQELENNVTLEAVEPGADGAEEERVERAEPEPQAERERELTVDEQDASSDFERLESMEESYSEAFENEYSAAGLSRLRELEPGPSRPASGDRDAKMEAMANTEGRGKSFTEQLLEQWVFAPVDERTRALGRLLIEHVEADGLLGAPLERIVERAPEALRPLEAEELERALRAVQISLEPAGIAARDRRECLLLQVDALEGEEGGDWRVARTLISDHLDDLVKNRLPRIAKETGLSMEEIKGAMAQMRRLSVSPGRELVDEAPPAVFPDAIVEYEEDGDRYIAYLTDGSLPALRINREYAEMVRDRESPKETREFIRRNLTNAQWLIDAIEQRRRTLQRVLNVVVEAQRDYFDQGSQALRPLPMTQVADQLGVHVATVSRAVSDKTLLTPRGMVALRSFFTGGIETESGEEMSYEAVRAALREVIDAEDKRKPLSDDALAGALKERGIEIARRTVAKYRDQLGVPSARLRKEF